MPTRSIGLPVLSRRRLLIMGSTAACSGLGLTACGTAATSPQTPRAQPDKNQLYRALNRLSWGVTEATMNAASSMGYQAYVDDQLQARGERPLPATAQVQIDELKIQRTPLHTLLRELETTCQRGEPLESEDERKAAQQAYQQELTSLAREAATRHLLRAVHTEQQLHAHICWFWLNHHQRKANVRAMVGDYEEAALRPHALGRFRDLLGAVAHHPAMLRYLDNDQNAVHRVNENYARELLELHTMGVAGGYGQPDVQALARVLTGLGINPGESPAKVRHELSALYVHQDAFEFNPNRHDFDSKTLLGLTLKKRGIREIDEALDLIARQPATASFISRKLAQYLLADDPPPALVERMAGEFQRSGGRIDATLRVLLLSAEFMAVDGKPKFKDPMHFVVSAVRSSSGDRIILNTTPMQNWLARMGEGLYNRQTPDGYPLTAAAWTSSGQLSTRFEIARTIGHGSAALFRSDKTAQATDQSAAPALANAWYLDTIDPMLSPDTRQALAQAGSPQEWNTLFLSSPEFMYR